MKTLYYLSLTLLTAFFATACGSPQTESQVAQDNPTEEQEQSGSNKGQAFIEDDGSRKNILQIAIGSKDHTTLVAAVQAAELENALVNAGPLTVFAPANTAFDALPAGTVENLVKPENKAKLANILKYHVTPGNLKKDFLPRMKRLGQANNQYVQVEKKDGEVYVGGAKIIASIPAGNGIIHVIDKVLLPPSE